MDTPAAMLQDVHFKVCLDRHLELASQFPRQNDRWIRHPSGVRPSCRENP